jgi:hypothetical protein
MPTPFSPATLALLQASFLAIVLPRVLSHGRVCFRHLKCRQSREDAIQEMIGLSWQWHLRLAEKGRDATLFPTALASYAARAVRCGRRFCGQKRANEVLSPLAQRERRFAVGKLPDFSTLNGSPLEEALRDNTVSPVPEQAAFRLDFPAWLAHLPDRDHAIVEDLLLGERTLDVANKYGVSPGRISQKRTAFCQNWQSFCGDDVPTARPHRPGMA